MLSCIKILSTSSYVALKKNISSFTGAKKLICVLHLDFVYNTNVCNTYSILINTVL